MKKLVSLESRRQERHLDFFHLKPPTGDGEIMFYGGCHKSSERVPGEWRAQHYDIAEYVNTYSPDILLIEGALDYHPKDSSYEQNIANFRAATREAVDERNHEGLLIAKAFSDIPFESAEPSPTDEFKHVSSQSSDLDFSFFYIVRDMRARGSFDASATFFKHKFDKPDIDLDAVRAHSIVMTGATLDELMVLETRAFNYLFAPSDYIDSKHVKQTNRVSDLSTDFRNYSIRCRIKHHVSNGKKVFAIYGSAHSQPVRKPLKLEDGYVSV